MKYDVSTINERATKALEKIGPAAEKAVPALIDALENNNESDVCRWNGDQTVDVSEYKEDEFGEFKRMTTTESKIMCLTGMDCIPADEMPYPDCIDKHQVTNI